jgi:HAD superfamily hydrolase (TIGR01509 family)
VTLSAAIFDFDGVIIETEQAYFDAWRSVYRENGAELGWEEYAVCIGTRGAFDPVADLEQKTGRRQDQDRVRARNKEIIGPLLAALKPLPGVMDRLDEADRLGIRLAIASSSSLEWVVGHLSTHGIMDRFCAILTRDGRLRPKPHPDLYLAALTALGVRGDEAVAFEDSRHGVTAAKEAGLFCVAVPNSMTARMDLSRADLVATSLTEVSFSSLASAVGRNGG